MDMGEFRTGGFLMEANRQFFHPLGLALEWDSGWTEEGLKQFILGVMRQEAAAAEEDPAEVTIEDVHPETIETIWRFIVEAGLDKPRISGVWDERDDPEGIAYGRKEYDDIGWYPWDSFDPDEVRAKAAMVAAERARHVEPREALFHKDGEGRTDTVQALP